MIVFIAIGIVEVVGTAAGFRGKRTIEKAAAGVAGVNTATAASATVAFTTTATTVAACLLAAEWTPLDSSP
jgi:VIT1/CCC1 family predicted Fe2+/Mn2+ transporter